MAIVSFRCASYANRQIRSIVFDLLSSREAPQIERGSRVLLKPNLLAPAAPDKAMTTHPLIVRAAAEYLLAKGARVQISDSPAMGSFSRQLAIGGYAKALEGLDVCVTPFKKTRMVDIGEPFGAIEIAEEALLADVVINLAKLKTHTQMLLTLGVKNLFGCIVGYQKPQWHLRAGVDREMFARLMVGICEAVKPAYTLIDGVLAMEGQGPGKSGIPRKLGVVVGGRNPHAVDHAVCLLVGLEPVKLPTHRQARQMDVYDGHVRVDGELHGVPDFQLPELGSLGMGPMPVNRFMRRYVIQQPTVDPRACKQCGECLKICPAAAISPSPAGIVFEKTICIRCYCCLEVCPHAAIRATKPLLGKVVAWLSRNRYERAGTKLGWTEKGR